MIYSRLKITFCVALILTIFNSCTQKNSEISNKIQLNFKYLPEIYDGYYQASAINGREYASLQKFIVNKAGQMHEWKTNKNIRKNILYTDIDVKNYDQIIITIEDQKDRKKKPSPIKILEADITKTAVSSPLTFRAVNLDNVSGFFQLSTPTDDLSDNEYSGVWFVKEKNGQIKSGLTIEPSPFEWIYEAWIANEFTVLSLGRFGDQFNKDDFNDYSGIVDRIKYPGEDFLTSEPQGINFPLNLADGKTRVFVTLQPWLGKSEIQHTQPYRFKILELSIPKNAETHKNIEMDVVKDTIPSGEVVFL